LLEIVDDLAHRLLGHAGVLGEHGSRVRCGRAPEHHLVTAGVGVSARLSVARAPLEVARNS
jgi:hypothetical protein